MDDTGNTELNCCYNCMTRMAPGQTVCPVCGNDNSRFKNPDSSLPGGTVLAGKYLVGRVLGQGGFGITYLGLDIALNIRVAIKEYFPAGIGMRSQHSIRVTAVASQDKAEGFRKGCEEFQKEAQRLAAIESLNIVRVRDYFRENGTAYIVMNYLDGSTLSKEAAACGGRMPWQRVMNLFMPLIPELDRLHQAHLMHRDIKPDNLKIVKDPDGAERLVLLDFGAARNFVSAEVTGTYSAMVTHGYAPLEQYSPKGRQGPYTDVYALCATMYAVITGVIPPAATDRISGELALAPIRSFGIPVPENVEQAILHGLAVKSSERTQTMRDLYRELYGDQQRLSSQRTGNYQTVFPNGQAVPQQMNVDAAQENGTQLPYQRNTQTPASQAQVPDPQSADPVKAEMEKNSSGSKKPVWLLIPLLLVLAAGMVYVLNQRAQTRMKQAVETPAAETQFLVNATQTKAAEPTAAPTYTPTPAVKSGDIITYGQYEQDGDLTNGAEAIEWQVLAVESDRALVISKYALDAKKYNEEWESVTWETSTLRTWLNGEFYNSAFSSEEKGQIRQVTLKNPDNADWGTKGGNDTTDRIFLLSIDEANQYFTNDKERKCRPTTYAKNNGARVNEDYGGTAWWWLRSPGGNGRSAAAVNTAVSIDYIGNIVDYAAGSVRPAFWLDL